MNHALSRCSLCVLIVACPGGDSGGSTADGVTTGGASSGGSDTPTSQASTTDTSTTDTSTTDTSTTDTPDTGDPADESVTLRDEACEKSPPAATRCESYEVVCAGLAPAIVDLAIYEGKAGVDPRGDPRVRQRRRGDRVL